MTGASIRSTSRRAPRRAEAAVAGHPEEVGEVELRPRLRDKGSRPVAEHVAEVRVHAAHQLGNAQSAPPADVQRQRADQPSFPPHNRDERLTRTAARSRAASRGA